MCVRHREGQRGRETERQTERQIETETFRGNVR